MDEDTKALIIIGLFIMFGILAFILPITICIQHSKDRDTELEKYKIEMQVKHGDVVEVE